jgi:hypothetical protein
MFTSYPSGMHIHSKVEQPLGVVMRISSLLSVTLLAWALGSGATLAQSAPAITAQEVVGNWNLRTTPEKRSDAGITFQSRDGGEVMDYPLTVQSGTDGRLACTLDDEPATCRIQRGRFVITAGGAGFSMVYTLTGRSNQGFSGNLSLRYRLLPFRGSIGVVNMTRQR